MREADVAIEELLEELGKASFEPDVYAELKRMFVTQAWYQKTLVLATMGTKKRLDNEHRMSLFHCAWQKVHRYEKLFKERVVDYNTECCEKGAYPSFFRKEARKCMKWQIKEVEVCQKNEAETKYLLQTLRKGMPFPRVQLHTTKSTPCERNVIMKRPNSKMLPSSCIKSVD